MMMNIRQNKGFTLIELMIVVVVIGILAAIAYPSFRDAVLKARRADAMDGIISIRLAQEKFRANCIKYATKLDTGSTSTSDTCVAPPDPEKYEIRHSGNSGDGYYTLALVLDEDLIDNNDFGYRIEAEPTSKGGQDEDKCQKFILKVFKGTVEKYTDEYPAGTAEAKRCWRR